MTHPIIEALRGKEAQFTELRRYFHQHPEIGFEEHNTSDRVAALLEEWGYEVHRGLAKTGVVGTAVWNAIASLYSDLKYGYDKQPFQAPGYIIT